MPSNLAVALAADHQIVVGGETLKVKAMANNPADQPAEQIAVSLRVPGGWTVAKHPTVEILQITPGQSASIGWRVRVSKSPMPGKYRLTAIANYRQGSEQEQTTADTAELEVPSPLIEEPEH